MNGDELALGVSKIILSVAAGADLMKDMRDCASLVLVFTEGTAVPLAPQGLY